VNRPLFYYNSKKVKMAKNSAKYLKSPLYWTVICAIIDFKGGKKYPIGEEKHGSVRK